MLKLLREFINQTGFAVCTHTSCSFSLAISVRPLHLYIPHTPSLWQSLWGPFICTHTSCSCSLTISVRALHLYIPHAPSLLQSLWGTFICTYLMLILSCNLCEGPSSVHTSCSFSLAISVRALHLYIPHAHSLWQSLWGTFICTYLMLLLSGNLCETPSSVHTSCSFSLAISVRDLHLYIPHAPSLWQSLWGPCTCRSRYWKPMDWCSDIFRYRNLKHRGIASLKSS